MYIAFHYPPILGSSGVHRSLAFTRHLSEQGWSVRVLTPSLAAYHKWSPEQLSFVPEKVNVIRAFARDVARHFSWRGKYLGRMAVPDNWQSWIPGGLLAGLWSVIRSRPDVIVSTYPIASAHVIAYLLHRLTGIPWVADLRDPMAQDNYPADPVKKRSFEWIERKIVRHCRFVMVTAEGAGDLYRERFPETAASFWRVVPNGYDEAIFAGVKAAHGQAGEEGKRVILHSGVIYPYERDPSQLFQALSELKREVNDSISTLHLRLRATGNEDAYQATIDALDIADIVSLEPPIPYAAALEEMLAVDGLLLLQADNCNYQIPAKAYEYLRAGKPVLALTPEEGDTGRLLARAGVADICPLDDKDRIKAALLSFLGKLKAGSFQPLTGVELEIYSRQHQAAVVEGMLRELN